MVPKAKLNLHACDYHLQNLIRSQHFEEIEINFAAFVSAARNTTFVLQKEFGTNPAFIRWYGDLEKEELLCAQCGKTRRVQIEPLAGTKQNQMKNDELCRFFADLRNQIVKEGISNLGCSTAITSLDTSQDFPDQPTGSSLAISNRGVYYEVGFGTSKEDLVPAISKTAKLATHIYIQGAPRTHLGQIIPNPNLLELSNLYHKYLTRIIEDWTGIINGSSI